SGLPEPGMLAGAMVRHEIEDDAYAALVQRARQRVEIAKRPEARIDIDIVGDVIAEVGHRRGGDRRQPDRIDAEPAQIIDALEDSAEIADAIAVAVLEGARIDLINDGRLPPGLIVQPRPRRFESQRPEFLASDRTGVTAKRS